ncbi:MAG: dihydroorotase, partial [Lachnospiraceae bacterium]|nr:dihydroorotase [Lachnospiraceae bacterium]
MLCVKNGMIIDPIEDRIYAGDLWIEGGVIKRIVERGQEGEPVPGNAGVLDAEGLMIGPGLIDTHVHFRDPGFTYKEDIISGGEAAKKGGYTGIVLMANTKPCVDNPETLKYVLEKGRQTGIRIETCANVTREMKGKEIVNMEELFREGAVGFTDDGIPLLDEDLVREAMKRAFRLGCPISFHEENPERILNNGIHEGKASAFYGIGGSKREAETDLIERDVKLALETGAGIVIQHISTREGVEIVRRARAKGAHVHAEATPHHFTLTQEAVIEKGTLAKMNPPLREEADRLAIIEGIADGTIDLIATDHAPHSREEKAQEITKAPSGIIGLETAFSLGIRELVEKGYLTYPQLFHRMSTAPSSL